MRAASLDDGEGTPELAAGGICHQEAGAVTEVKWDKENTDYIRSMAILPEARGRRIGEQLLSEIEHYAVAHNFRRLFLSTTSFLEPALRLYEKCGFVRRGADDLFGTPLIRMDKELSWEKLFYRSHLP